MTDHVPAGYTAVAPWVVTEDTAALLEFIAVAFDGEELSRVQVEDGSIGHAEIRVGDSVVLAFDRRPDWPAMPALLRVWVPDADAAIAAAVDAGARTITPSSDSAFGQRGGRVRDPFGNIWWVVTQAENVTEQEMWSRFSQPAYRESMRVAQATLDAELSGCTTGHTSAPIAPRACSSSD